MSYAVGQVFYVVLNKQAAVYPMQVVEEITKKTLEGAVTTYMVRGQDAEKQMIITDIDGEIFDSADAARKALIDRVSQSITERVDTAVSQAKEWYPTGFESASGDPMAMIKKTTQLGDVQQQQAPVKNRGQFQKKGTPSFEVAQLAAEMQAEADAAVMDVPDGNGGMTRVKVKSLKLSPNMQE